MPERPFPKRPLPKTAVSRPIKKPFIPPNSTIGRLAVVLGSGLLGNVLSGMIPSNPVFGYSVFEHFSFSIRAMFLYLRSNVIGFVIRHVNQRKWAPQCLHSAGLIWIHCYKFLLSFYFWLSFPSYLLSLHLVRLTL